MANANAIAMTKAKVKKIAPMQGRFFCMTNLTNLTKFLLKLVKLVKLVMAFFCYETFRVSTISTISPQTNTSFISCEWHSPLMLPNAIVSCC